MKKLFKTLLVVVAALIFISCGCENGGYKVAGDIKNIEGTVYLTFLEGKMPQIVDSVVVKDGKFSFKGDLSLPAYAGLQQKDDKYPFLMFFIENSEISIIGDRLKPKEISVIGSVENDLYSKEYMPTSSDLDKSKEFVKNNPTSIAASYVLFRNLIYQLPVDELESLRDGLAAELHQSSYIKILNIRLEAMKNSEVGKKYMDINLPDTAGNNIALSSLLKEGKYVLLDFWASWCPPCRAENPHVVEAFKKYSPLGFTVYGVSLDRSGDQESWKKAINNDKLTWSNVSDLKYWECVPAAQYGVNSIPSNFLISPEGTIVGKNLRGDALEEKLEELLGGKKDK